MVLMYNVLIKRRNNEDFNLRVISPVLESKSKPGHKESNRRTSAVSGSFTSNSTRPNSSPAYNSSNMRFK